MLFKERIENNVPGLVIHMVRWQEEHCKEIGMRYQKIILLKTWLLMKESHVPNHKEKKQVSFHLSVKDRWLNPPF